MHSTGGLRPTNLPVTVPEPTSVSQIFVRMCSGAAGMLRNIIYKVAISEFICFAEIKANTVQYALYPH